MDKSYSNESIKDGTQWAFWLTQGSGEKTIYFNNDFPSAITAFAEDLDEVLHAAGIENATWTPLDPGHKREHECPLWDAMR